MSSHSLARDQTAGGAGHTDGNRDVTAQPPPPRSGCVYLVGAGPGSPDLITVRGLNLLRRADVVVYDALVHRDLLAEAPPDAERVYAGKRGYCVGSTLQETINDVLVNRLHVIDTKIAWLASPTLALPAIVAVDVWKTTPFMALLLLAGL